MKEERDALLHALGWMYEQYCSKEGHLFMGAGEQTSELLERYGLLDADGAGRGKVDTDKLEKLIHPYNLGAITPLNL